VYEPLQIKPLNEDAIGPEGWLMIAKTVSVQPFEVVAVIV